MIRPTAQPGDAVVGTAWTYALSPGRFFTSDARPDARRPGPWPATAGHNRARNPRAKRARNLRHRQVLWPSSASAPAPPAASPERDERQPPRQACKPRGGMGTARSRKGDLGLVGFRASSRAPGVAPGTSPDGRVSPGAGRHCGPGGVAMAAGSAGPRSQPGVTWEIPGVALQPSERCRTPTRSRVRDGPTAVADTLKLRLSVAPVWRLASVPQTAEVLLPGEISLHTQGRRSFLYLHAGSLYYERHMMGMDNNDFWASWEDTRTTGPKSSTPLP